MLEKKVLYDWSSQWIFQRLSVSQDTGFLAAFTHVPLYLYLRNQKNDQFKSVYFFASI